MRNRQRTASLHVLVFLLFTSVVMAQEADFTADRPHPSDYKNSGAWKRDLAAWQINSLKEGVLLVRLSYRENSIEKLRELGQTERAEKYEKEIAQKNQSIIDAFKLNFRFAPVYFFSAQHSDLVRGHHFDKLPIIDKSQNAVDLDQLAGSSFLVAEFTTLSKDTAKYKDYKLASDYHPTGTTYYSNSNNGISALVIKSDQFIQLDSPFPYYVRSFKGMPFGLNRTDEETVIRMERKLREFYGE